ncbi:hypothetical protein RUA4292_03055 [Ruegeria atlantica]|uniref:Uncharacterized protein n=1 Tax=Ruegeria atlantica TaxID=81569 RepID=A0A0P1EG86_9RHOB|nr:hypothetical protein RUA4292_03055 [Ruegeria atlantica]
MQNIIARRNFAVAVAEEAGALALECFAAVLSG